MDDANPHVEALTPEPVNFNRGYLVELCPCSHQLDHRGRACGHDGCQCKNGVRTDVALCAMTNTLVQGMKALNAQLHDLTMILLEAHQLEVTGEGQVVKKSLIAGI